MYRKNIMEMNQHIHLGVRSPGQPIRHSIQKQSSGQHLLQESLTFRCSPSRQASSPRESRSATEAQSGANPCNGKHR